MFAWPSSPCRRDARKIALLIVVLSAPIFPALVRGDIAYTLRDLGTIPGGNGSLALGLNDQGEVVGTSTIGSDSRAFLYSNGAMIQLPTAGLAPAWAQGINDASLVVGIVGTSITSDAQPFVFSTSTGLSLWAPTPPEDGWNSGRSSRM